MEMLEQYRSKFFNKLKTNFLFLLFSVRDEGTPIVPIDGDDSEESDKEAAAEPAIPSRKVAEVMPSVALKLSF